MSKPEEQSGFGIDVGREAILPFGAAARFVGNLKGTKRIALQTLHRWATKGCRGVVLETICVGGARCTSKEALQRFFAAVTVVRDGEPIEAPVAARPTLATVPRSEADVDAVLRHSGISESEGAA